MNTNTNCDKNMENRSIACSVKQCANHSKCGDYCALEKIRIGTHEANPTATQCTDCESFVLDAKDCGCSK